MSDLSGGTTIAGYLALHLGNLNPDTMGNLLSTPVDATGSSNVYSASVPSMSSYIDLLPLTLRCDVASNGAVSININGLGAKPLIDYYNQAVTDIQANSIISVTYNAKANSGSGAFTLRGKGGGGTATASTILAGYTATVTGGKVTGNIPLRTNTGGDGGSANWWLNSGISYTSNRIFLKPVPNDGSTYAYKGDCWVCATEASVATAIGLTSAKIAKGQTVLGTAGTYTADATAVAGHILAGDTAYINGAKVTGTMADRGNYQMAGGIWGNGSGATAYTALNNIPEGYYHKDGQDWAPEVRILNTDLVNYLGLTPAKLTNDATVLGITGTGYKSGYGLTYSQVNHVLSADTSLRVTASVFRIDCDQWNCRFVVSMGTPLQRFDWQGNSLWYYTAPDDIRALSAGKKSDIVAIGTCTGTCQLINAGNGSLIWSVVLRTSAFVTAIKISTDMNYVYVAYGYGSSPTYYLRKMNRSNGSTVWEKTVSAGIKDIQIDFFGNVLVGYDSSSVPNAVFNPNGSQIVTLNGANYYTTSIVAEDGRYYYTSDYKSVKKYDTGGNLLWSLDMGAIVSQVHIKPNSNYIYALCSSKAWQISRDGAIFDTYNFGQVGDHASVLNDFGQLYVATSYSYVDAYYEWIVLK